MSQMMSPETFVKEFGPALQEYLEYQYRNEGHILDMTAASGEFFTVSYHSVHAAMNALQYTEPTASKGRASSKK
jgi:hypothetical protein